jgi:alpha-mannosidase
MQRFVDLSNDSLGITWCSPDAPLFESGSITANNTAGWDGKGDVWPASLAPGSTVYSWVMNNHWFTNAPLTQDGPVTFRYGMLPHGPYDQARAYRFGVEHSQPLIALAVDRDPAIRPPIGISGDRIAATILKPSADGKSMIVRLRSLSDHNETVALSWPALRPKSVRVCDRGEVPGPTDASSSTIVPARGFTTLWVEWR